MKNTILNYETEELILEENGATFDVYDYFSTDARIYNIIDTLGEYLDTYQITNDDKLERISFELYGNEDYWDILLMLNDRNPMFEMPYEYDLLFDFSLERSNFYKNVIYSHAPLTQLRADALNEEILELALDINEEYRTIYIIKPEKMNNFISLLKAQNYL